MIGIEWTMLAFDQLEAIPDSIAAEIVRRVDALAAFPEMGASLREHFRTEFNYRQLIVQRNWRVIYRYDADRALIYIAAVQHCRQQMPNYGELQREIRRRQ
jgi:plasmid stabilization system protein ParE